MNRTGFSCISDPSFQVFKKFPGTKQQEVLGAKCILMDGSECTSSSLWGWPPEAAMGNSTFRPEMGADSVQSSLSSSGARRKCGFRGIQSEQATFWETLGKAADKHHPSAAHVLSLQGEVKSLEEESWKAPWAPRVNGTLLRRVCSLLSRAVIQMQLPREIIYLVNGSRVLGSVMVGEA